MSKEIKKLREFGAKVLETKRAYRRQDILMMPNKCLCFGLPGTGKTTFVKTHSRYPLHLDIGHNAFKTEEERDKFFRKLHKHTTSELGLLSSIKQGWLYDAYPDYFEVTDVKDYGNVEVIFAIPTDYELDYHIIPRIITRGDSPNFVNLYKKNGHNWIKDWWHRYEQWKSIIGRHRCRVIAAYDSVEWIQS